MLDEAILEELERGFPGWVTQKQIGERLQKRLYEALQRLVRAERLEKADCLGGTGGEKVYSLPNHSKIAAEPLFRVRHLT